MERFGKNDQRGWKSRTRKNNIGSSILSRAGPEKSCLNLAAPSAKAKYYQETDSEQVLWRKGEKHFEQKSEIEPETVRLQAVGVL